MLSSSQKPVLVALLYSLSYCWSRIARFYFVKTSQIPGHESNQVMSRTRSVRFRVGRRSLYVSPPRVECCMLKYLYTKLNMAPDCASPHSAARSLFLPGCRFSFHDHEARVNCLMRHSVNPSCYCTHTCATPSMASCVCFDVA